MSLRMYILFEEEPHVYFSMQSEHLLFEAEDDIYIGQAMTLSMCSKEKKTIFTLVSKCTLW